ncbi:MAG: ABC transporter permease [Ferruginibacter sp.]
MLNNYIRIGWRNIMKNKIFSFINIMGLTIGLTSFLLIALYIFDELTFDRFHKNEANIYRLINEKTTAEGKQTKNAGAGYQVCERSAKDLPEIKNTVRFITLSRTNVAAIENTNVFYENYTLANNGFLTTFDFRLLQGDRNSALTAPHSVVITEGMAQKLFGTRDAMGKAIKVDRDSTPFKVTGILQNFPANAHLNFNLLFSESSMTDNEYKKFINADWNSGAFTTYFLLADKVDTRKTALKIDQMVAANQPKEVKDKSRFVLQPLKDIHFYSEKIGGDSGKQGNITYIYVFCIVALFVLLIACINYMNLTTARFITRSKEIAVRKVAGASRKNLAGQFLSEAFLITFIALMFSLILTSILLPLFNRFTEKELTLWVHADYRIWIGVVLIVVVTGLLSGVYPALFQSGFTPLSLLKSKIIIGRGNLSLRRSLVVFQFAISIIMIVATMIIYLQMQYVGTRDMGFNKEQLLVIDINSGKVRRGAETIKTEFLKLPQVKDVSVSSRVPGEWKDLPQIKVKNEKIISAEGNDMFFLGIDDRFLNTYQVTLANGRNFINGVADSASVIINEMAAKEFGIREAGEQRIEIAGQQPFVAKVIGIVKDFNFQSLHEPLAPMVIGFQKNPIQNIDYFTLKVATGNAGDMLNGIDAVLHGIDQDHLFEYHFLNKQWELFYRQDHIREVIFLLAAALTIFIACLGLFGLATYAAEQRIKEIGIRKVLGAGIFNIVLNLSKDFLKLVLIAAALAFPVAWWAMSQWLHDFAYRISISWWVFVLAGLTALFIALATISFQAVKAAMANPVKSLRTE